MNGITFQNASSISWNGENMLTPCIIAKKRQRERDPAMF